MRKESRQMPAEWVLEVLDKAPYITVSIADDEGERFLPHHMDAFDV